MLLYESQTSIIHALAFSPDGVHLASASRDGCLMLHGLDGSAQPLGNSLKTSPLYAVAFHPELPLLAYGGEHGWSCLREDESGQWNPYGPSMATPTSDLAFLDRKTLAVGLGERLKPAPGRFELWDLPTGRKGEQFYVENQGVRAVAVAPRKSVVAWIANQRNISVWDVRKQDPVKFTQPAALLAVAINRDATILAVSHDWVVHLYDLAKNREMQVLKVHKGKVDALAFSPDGRTLATGSWDRTVRLWDAASGREERVYEWPVGRVSRLAFAADGTRLAAGGDTGSVVVWDLE